MGRPKGSKTKPLLDSNNIVESRKKVNDENQNPLPSSAAPPVKKARQTMGTRKKSKTDSLWHSFVGPPLDHFPVSKLPQNVAVLRRFLRLRETFPKVKQFVLVYKLYDEMLNGIWIPARIPTVSEMLCKIRIKKLIEKFKDLKHFTFTGGRECPEKVKEIKDLLCQLCDLSPANLYEMLKKTARLNKEWESDWQFYMNMCQPKQVGCIAGEDVKLAGKETTKQDKEDTEDNLADQEASQKRKRGATVTGVEFDDGVEEEEDLNDPDEIQRGKRREGEETVARLFLRLTLER